MASKMKEISEEVHGQLKDHHIFVEINRANEELVASIKKKIEDASSQVFIFRVPENPDDKSFSPAKVSIGPFHYGRQDLKPMEDKKWKYTASLLSRKPNLGESLDACVKALREFEHKARNCYGENISLSSDEFVQMMLFDCCFIIELFLKYSIKGLGRRNDDLFTTPGMLFDIRRDMILLENQIPLFVLRKLFHVVSIPSQCTMSFSEIASRFFMNIVPGDFEHLKERFNQEGYHFLDLIRRCIAPNRPKIHPLEGDISTTILDPAKKLRKARVGFKKGKSYNLLDVSFINGVLTIPQVKIHECMGELFGNIIALESHLEDSQQMTSYAFLMRCLVQSENDVRFLGEQGIFCYTKGNEKEVVNMFQRLGKEATVKDFYYLRLIQQVDEYKTKSFHPKLKNYLKKKRFSIVVILLLLLIFVVVFFSIMSFRHH